MFKFVRRALFSPRHSSEVTQTDLAMPVDVYLQPPTPAQTEDFVKASEAYRNRQMIDYYPPPHHAASYPNYPTPHHYQPEMYHRRKRKQPPRSCANECQNVLALLCFCVGIIVKGVAYGNSHWTDHDEIDFNEKKEEFPIMTNFLDMKNGKYENSCEDMKCRIFFEKYNALQTVASASGKPQVPLRGIYSRGVNMRCETVYLVSVAGDLMPLSTSNGAAKYEKCVVDKQTEVNEYRTVRILLATSMVADGIGILAWIVLFVRLPRASLTRLALVVAALVGFISALLTGLSVGLFAQAVDIMEDAGLYLGWPFYITILAGVLAVIASIIAGVMLFKERQRSAKLEAMTMMRPAFTAPANYYRNNHARISPSVSVVELDSSNNSTAMAPSQQQADVVLMPPPTRSKSREKLADSRSLAGSVENLERSQANSARSSKKSEGASSRLKTRFQLSNDGNNSDEVGSVGSSGQNQQPLQPPNPLLRNHFQRNDSGARGSNRSAADSIDTLDRLYLGYRRNDPNLRSNRSNFNDAI